jgi:hypothetical protein
VTFVDTHGLSNRPCSYTGLSLPELESGDEVFFQATYGETADIVQGLLEKKIYPDASENTVLFEYGIRF